MKKRVDMSGAAFAITLAIAVMLVCMVFVGYPRLETLGVALFVSVVVLLMLMALFYAPMSLSLDDKELCVCRSFWVNEFPCRKSGKCGRSVRTCHCQEFAVAADLWDTGDGSVRPA